MCVIEFVQSSHMSVSRYQDTTISILTKTVRPSVHCRFDDTAFGSETFLWQDPVHSWKTVPVRSWLWKIHYLLDWHTSSNHAHFWVLDWHQSPWKFTLDISAIHLLIWPSTHSTLPDRQSRAEPVSFWQLVWFGATFLPPFLGSFSRSDRNLPVGCSKMQKYTVRAPL